MVQQILRRPDLETKLGLSRSTIYALMSKGQFPRPIKLGCRAVGWRSNDIEKWLSEMQGEVS